MITHKHLKELGFSRIGKRMWKHGNGCVYFYDAVENETYWSLRKRLNSSVQLSLGFKFNRFDEKIQNIEFEGLNGDRHTIWNMSINIGFLMPDFGNVGESVVYFGFFSGENNSNQIELF